MFQIYLKIVDSGKNTYIKLNVYSYIILNFYRL